MKSIAVSLLILFTAILLPAQPREGKTKELSISGSYQNSEGFGAFIIAPRVGFYVLEGLEIEPEGVLMLATGGSAAYMVNGNVSYNFIGNGRAVPFLLVGYGRANSVPVFNIPLRETNFPVGVLNVGAGIKAFLTEDIALRIEYRFQNFRGEGETQNYNFSGYSFSYTQKIDYNLHTVQFGLSVLP